MMKNRPRLLVASGVAFVVASALLLAFRSGPQDGLPALRVHFTGLTNATDGQTLALFAVSNRSSHLVLRQGVYDLINRPSPAPGELRGNVNGYAYLGPGQSEQITVPVVPGEGEWRLRLICYRETWQRRLGQRLLAHRTTWGIGAVVRMIPLRHLGVASEHIESDPVPAAAK